MRWFKRKQKCNHFKRGGEKWPDNMVELVRFSPYETDSLGYGVSECTICKKRGFCCVTLHSMSNLQTGVVDMFIQHKMSWDAFKEFLDKNMAWHKEASIKE